MRKWIKALICAMLIASFMLAPVSALAAKNAKIYIVNTSGARLRSGANRTNIVASLKKGTRVVFNGKKQGSMYYVRTSSGQTGFIYKNYLSPYGAAPAKQFYRIASKTTIYKKVGNKPKPNGTLSKGTTVIVYETRGSWAYIKTLSGKSGYVKKSKLRKK